jgi:hypothetical protein
MSLRIFAAMWPCFLWLALTASDFSWDRPISKEAFFMANEMEAPVIPMRATEATTRPTMVPLNELVLQPERYSHRDPVELTDRDRLEPLMNSLIVDGQLDAIEYFIGPHGEKVVDRGNRRISAMRMLGADNVPNFTATMPVKAEEVVNAKPTDLLVRSVMDNMNRKTLSSVEQIRAAKCRGLTQRCSRRRPRLSHPGMKVSAGRRC